MKMYDSFHLEKWNVLKVLSMLPLPRLWLTSTKIQERSLPGMASPSVNVSAGASAGVSGRTSGATDHR